MFNSCCPMLTEICVEQKAANMQHPLVIIRYSQCKVHPQQQNLAILSHKLLNDYIIIFLQLKRAGNIKSMLILTFKINYNV